MFDVLAQTDTIITTFIHATIPHNPFFDTFFTYLSLFGNSLFVWLIIIVVLIVIEERKDKRFIFYFLTSFLITTVLVNVVMKTIYHRPRPPVATTIHHVFTCPTDYSFPSGHASAAFASAVIVSAFDRKRRYFYYVVAFLISLSRIYLGCHYFFDVVTGGVIGSIISQIVLYIGIKTAPTLG